MVGGWGANWDMSYNFPRVELISAGGFPRTSFHFEIENWIDCRQLIWKSEGIQNKIEGGHGEW